jgi:hypothetical protein
MKAPCSTLVLDAAVLVAAARAKLACNIGAAGAASLVTTDRAVHEARRHIEIGLKRPELLEVLYTLIAEMTVVPVAALAPHSRAVRSYCVMRSQAATGRPGTPMSWR